MFGLIANAAKHTGISQVSGARDRLLSSNASAPNGTVLHSAKQGVMSVLIAKAEKAYRIPTGL